MRTFVKENWYKLMVGSSMVMASFGFMVYAVSPAYSNSEMKEAEMKGAEMTSSKLVNAVNSTNGVVLGDYAYFVDNGTVYMYHFRERNFEEGRFNAWNDKGNWAKHEIYDVQTW